MVIIAINTYNNGTYIRPDTDQLGHNKKLQPGESGLFYKQLKLKVMEKKEEKKVSTSEKLVALQIAKDWSGKIL